MSAQTYTITQSTFEAESGENISGGGNSTVTLVLAPTAGYAISSGNFTTQNLPAEVDSVVFSQAGVNINALVTFAAGFIMPAADVTLLIDIDGTADEQTFTIDGEYTIAQLNTQQSATTPIAFSQTAVSGTEVTLFTKTFTADSGYVYDVPPYYYQTQGAARNEDAYIITYADNGLGNILSRIFTVKYLINGQSKTLNDLNFVANAEEIYVPAVEVTSYVISTAKIPAAGQTRIMTFYGGAGADVTIALPAPYPVLGYINTNTNVTLTIGDGGFVDHTFIFPANTTGGNKTWTWTLTGDLASPFPNDNPLSIIQLG